MLFFIGLQIKYEILIYESSVYLFFWKSGEGENFIGGPESMCVGCKH
jgi:hypothetical protein